MWTPGIPRPRHDGRTAWWLESCAGRADEDDAWTQRLASWPVVHQRLTHPKCRALPMTLTMVSFATDDEGNEILTYAFERVGQGD